MTHFIWFHFQIQSKIFERVWIWSLKAEVHCFFWETATSERPNGHKRPPFLSLRCFNVTTPPTKLTSQPPTSQVAKQICYCLSAQYESHASSWLDGKLQTKRDQVNLVRIFCFNSTTISIWHFFFFCFSWSEWTARVCRDGTSVAICAFSPCKRMCCRPASQLAHLQQFQGHFSLCSFDFSVVLRIIKNENLSELCIFHCFCIIQLFSCHCCLSLLTRCSLGTINS